jgi:hypothetical protein
MIDLQAFWRNPMDAMSRIGKTFREHSRSGQPLAPIRLGLARHRGGPRCQMVEASVSWRTSPDLRLFPGDG